MIYRTFFISAILVTLCLSIATPVSAHGRTPRLEISVERMNPGGVVDIRGVEFDYEESITLYLERPGIAVELGQIIADLEGIFIHTIVLPVDLPAGVYNIRGVTEHHDVLSPALSVQGPAALSEGGGQGERDDDDGLLAPMPTYAPGVVPGGVPQPAVQQTSQETPVSRGTTATVLVLSICLVLAIFVLFRQRAAGKR